MHCTTDWRTNCLRVLRCRRVQGKVGARLVEACEGSMAFGLRV